MSPPNTTVPSDASTTALSSRTDASTTTAHGWDVRLGGFIQADAILSNQASQNSLDGSTGAPLNQTRFLIRRARPRVDVSYDFVWAGLELDANTISGMHAGATEADVGTLWHAQLWGEPASLRLTLGLFRIPFGREVPERDPDRFFLERTNLSHALFPGSIDLGARMETAWGPLRFAAAIMNGNPTGDVFLPGQDPIAAKDAIGRLGVDTKLADSVRFELGFSVVSGTGFHANTPSTKDVLVWRDANENGIVEPSEIQVIAGTAASPAQTFDRFALGSDVRLTAAIPVVGDLTLAGELVWAKNLDRGLEPADPVALGRDVRESGFYLSATQELTRFAMLGVRYDRYNPDLDGSEQRGVALVPRDSSYSTFALAAALRYRPGRLILEYDINGNALGRTASGVPTTLADNQLALRGEVVF